MGRIPALGLQGKWEGGFDLPSAVLLRAVPQRQKQRNSHYLHSHEAQSELELESTPRGLLVTPAPLDSFWTLPPVFRLCGRERVETQTSPPGLRGWQEDGSGQLPFGNWLAMATMHLAPPPDAQTALPLSSHTHFSSCSARRLLGRA